MSHHAHHAYRLSEAHPYLGCLMVVAFIIGTVALVGIAAVKMGGEVS